MGRRRQEEIDIIRGIAIILVILGHSIIKYPINIMQEDWCAALFALICTIQMPLFFFVSGYCYRDGRDYSGYVKSRFRRIMVPYFAFSVLDLLMRTLFPSLVNRKYSVSENLINIVFYGGEYWYLYVIFMISCIFPFISRIFCKKGSTTLLLAGICLTVSVCRSFIEIPELPFRLEQVFTQMIYFVIGFCCQRINLFAALRAKRRSGFIAILIYAISCFLRVMLEWPVAVLCGLSGCIAFAYLATVITGKSKILVLAGKNTLPLYLLNGYALVLSRTIITKITVLPFVILIFNFAVDFGLMLFVIQYLNRFKLFRWVTGG